MTNKNKELKEQYKKLKPEMGILIIKNKLENKCHLEATVDLRSMINRVNFQLKLGAHRNRELQQAWKEKGKDAFVIEIVDKLDYSKDESKTDYNDDLAMLKTIWSEKLVNESAMTFY